MATYLGIDLGTSGVKALLIDDDQRLMGEASAALSVSRPHPGWSEQDPDDWIDAAKAAIAALGRDHDLSGLAGIGLSGQMHGATLLGADDRPLRPAILWNDGRSGAECDALDAAADFRGIGGNLVMAGFTAPKLLWVQRHEPEIFERIAKVLLPKDYLRLWLTGAHVSDMSDSAGTLWLDVAARDWSPALLDATGLGRDHMPALVEGAAPGGTLRAELADEWGVPRVPVAGGGGDNAATACGMGLTAPGQGFLSLGTSGVLFAVTDRFAPNTDQAVHAFCHAIPDTWHQMGVILSATDSLAWLSEITGRDAPDLAQAVGQVDGPAAATFLPYLSGERTPLNAPEATASFTGLARGMDVCALTHAAMDGVAFAFADCASALSAAGTEIEAAFATGGGARSDGWLRIIAAATGITLLKPQAGDFGAAFGAARLGLCAATGAAPSEVMTTPEVIGEVAPDPALASAYADGAARFQAAKAALIQA